MRPSAPLGLLFIALLGAGCADVDALSAQDELTLRAVSGEEEDAAVGSADFAVRAGDAEAQPLFRECDADRTLAALTEHFDADGDGEVRGAEEDAVAAEAAGDRRSQRRAHHFRHLAFVYDADDSGDLDDAERQALLDDFTARCEAIHARLLEEFDSDGDGELSETEQEAVREAIEARRAEREAARADGEGGEGMCNRGEGGDEAGMQGRPPRGERPAREEDGGAPPRLVEEFDVDGDGELDVEETQALRETVRARIRSGEPRM